MDAEEFRKHGRQMIDYVSDYLENIRSRRPFPHVQPGYLRKLVPEQAPDVGERWEDVFKDIERVIMPGVTHWQSPQFHAYFPSANSYPGILADILSDAISCIGFTWTSSPACTELEVVTLDWLGKMLNLPEQFLACSGGKGGGVIQGSASETTLVSLLAARTRTIHQFKAKHPDTEDGHIIAKMVAYCSVDAHSSVERAGLIAVIKMRQLETDDNFSLRGPTLKDAVEADRDKGLIPMFVCAALGTTSCCSFDNVLELGQVCDAENIWMHIDAAYAGCSFICPEFRPLLDGVQYAESLNVSPHKWMRVNHDCSAMWVKDSSLISDAFNVNNAVYLRHENQDSMPDFRHWQIPLGRRFRSLKLWFVLRLYGVKGLQEYIRHNVALAKEFEKMVQTDSRFEIIGKVRLGLVCFRLKMCNEVNQTLIKNINDDRRIHMVPSVVKGAFFLRFVICAASTTIDDVILAWNVIREITDNLLSSNPTADSEI